jgi:hypothetical protein
MASAWACDERGDLIAAVWLIVGGRRGGRAMSEAT